MNGGDSDLTWLPAWRLRELMVGRQVSPVEVTRHFLARIDRLEPALHCFFTLAHDEALRTAQVLEASLRAGAAPGPLFGVPVSVKDQYWSRGLRSTCGSLVYRDHIPAEDAACVEKLRAAGAVVIGKTTTPEFGMFWRAAGLLGPETLNPWDNGRISGGSSGGAAAGVAAAMTPIAVASDGGGSIRLPAAFCGVFGLQPSLGRVSRYGSIGGALQFTGIGPIARDVRDAALVLQALAGPDARDPTTRRDPPAPYAELLSRATGPLRAAWWTEREGIMANGHDPKVAEHCRGAAAAFEAGGNRIEELPERLDLVGWLEAFQTISRSDRYGLHGKALYDDPAQRALLTPYVREAYGLAATLTGGQYAQALRVRFQAIAALDRLFDRYDCILSPTAGFIAPAVPPDLIARPPALMTYTCPVNFTGTTAATVPCGFVNGMPVGLQVFARAGEEAKVLQIAALLSERLGSFTRRPPAA